MDESFQAVGHHHVKATHSSTLEVTSDDYLTPAGDCIVAIEAETVPSAFEESFVAACQDHASTIELTITAGEHAATVTGSGHPELSFESDRSFVCRTSEYVDERTVMVEADTAAADLDRDLVTALANVAAATVTLRVDRI
jgi:hypothetical protein